MKSERGQGLGLFGALLVFVVFAALVYLAATGGQGFNGLLSGAPFAPALPNTGPLVDQANQRAAQGYQALNEAQRLQAAAAQTEQSYAYWSAQATRAAADESARQTAAVQSTATVQVMQVTIEAARAQDTATAAVRGTEWAAEMQSTYMAQTSAAIKVQALAVESTQIARDAENQTRLNAAATAARLKWAWIQPLVWPFILLVLAGGAGWVLYNRLKIQRETAAVFVPTNENGTHHGVVMGGKLHNLDHSSAATIDPRNPVQPALPDSELEIAKLHQGVQAARALTLAGYRREARAASDAIAAQSVQPSGGPQVLPQAGAAAANPDDLPVTVPWSVMSSWSGGKFVLGQGAGGSLIQIDPNDDAAPHLLMAGTSGSGKTHFGLHPVIAQALADLWQVIILDRTGIGFSMFSGHPNARTVLLDDPAQAIGYLGAAYQEVIRRQRELARLGIWKWSNWVGAPAPKIALVIDEFSDLADEIGDGAGREQLWRNARMVAAEGRKAGIFLLIALQDPSHRSIDLRIRRNCSRVAFQVQDAAASRIILGVDGAEKLQKQQFMTAIGGQVMRGTAFDARQQEIEDFLAAHPAPTLPAPDWCQVGPGAQAIVPLLEPSEDEKRAQLIRELAGQGLSMNKIQDRVFGYTGGKAYQAVCTVLGGSTTTTNSASTTRPAPAGS